MYMKMKKVIATMLTLTLALALLAGCNKLEVSTSSDGSVSFSPKKEADIVKFTQEYADTSELLLNLFDYAADATLTPLTSLSQLTKLKIIWGGEYWGGKKAGREFDYSSLADLSSLRSLEFSMDEIPLSSLSKLTQITELDVGTNDSDISPLANLTQLTYLRIYGENITDITPITALINLNGEYKDARGLTNSCVHLYVSDNCDLSPLYSMPNFDPIWIPSDYAGPVGEIPEPEPEPLSEYEQFLVDNNITLTNYDVQYDIANSAGEYFYFEDFGVAELDDYYNYGYRGTESEFFVMTITPGAKIGSDDYAVGSYMDHWYIYADREQFANLFDRMKSFKGDGEEISGYFVCQIDPDHYDSGETMATPVWYDFNVTGSGLLLTWS
jgi:hypothetical protein